MLMVGVGLSDPYLFEAEDGGQDRLRASKWLPLGALPCIKCLTTSRVAASVEVAERAGIKDLHIQDLRHTAATRMGLKTGNIFLVKALTGHKTLSMVERYVNVKAEDAIKVLHAPESDAKEPDQVPVPPTLTDEQLQALTAAMTAGTRPPDTGKVVVPFRRAA